MTKSLADFVRQLGTMQDNTLHGSLAGRVVADLNSDSVDVQRAILDAGAARCLVIGDAVAQADPRVEQLPGQWEHAALPRVDVAFYDDRRAASDDPVHGLTRLIERLRSVLTPDGLLFAIVRTASVHPGFDVSNSILNTPTSVLPSDAYFFDVVAKACAVRVLDWLPSEEPGIATRFMRLAIKRPTLLLIFGRSQSGKTSLARDLRDLDRHMHVSNDYIYCELARLRDSGHAGRFDADLLARLGDGGGVDCGRFNRLLEGDPDLLQRYLQVVEASLPRDRQLVSMDLDLVDDQQIGRIVRYFETRGFSVWVVKRDGTRTPTPAAR